MVDIATKVPDSVFAGDRLRFNREYADYPGATYTVTITLAGGGNKYELADTKDGNTHTFTALPSATEKWVPGRYSVVARAVLDADATDVTTIEKTWIDVFGDPTSESADLRSHARKMVDACEAILEKRADKNQLDLINYSLGGAVNASRDINLVIRIRDRYRAIVRDEENPGTNRRHTFIRFS